ncbi:uncharacterized protein LOC133522468 isoform X2 [Cydia pomonella]|nr:uncharacterized protein LOC133522468 isoform X2 [Cydia pomonella]
MKIDMPGDIMKFTQAICLLSLYGDTLMPFHASSHWMAVVKEYACAVLHFVVLLATYVVPGCERPEDEYKRASMAVGALAHYVSAFHLIYKGEGEAKESPSPRRPPPRAA